jgi:4-amino-4-deoxy-L-arabinose transferase-like glycosyltransferase
MRAKTTTIILILITAMAFFLRVHGINYYSYGDEAYHVYNSLGLGSGQLPKNFHRIALFLFYSVFYVMGWFLGIFTTPKAFIGSYFSHQHVFYFAGRVFETLMGTAAVPFLYLLGKSMFSRRTALAAAFFLAISPAAVEISQIARGQALALTLVICAMYFSYLMIREEKTINYILAGSLLGAAVSIRIFCLVIFLPIIWYLWIRAASQSGANRSSRPGVRFLRLIGHRGFWIIVLSFIVIFLLSHPGRVLSLGRYITYNVADIAGGEEKIYPGCEFANSWKYYLTSGFPTALSWPIYLLFIAGSIRAFIKKNRDGIILTSTCLVYFLIMGKGIIAAPRYLFPIIPACLLLGADVIFRLSGGGQSRARWRDCLVVLVVILLSIPAGKTVMEGNRRNRLKTTKNLAEEWIFENVPYGSRIAVERMGYNGPDLKLTPVLDYWIYNLSEAELEELLAERLEQGQPSVALKHFIENPPEKKYYTTTISIREIIDTNQLEREKYEYVVALPSVAEIYRDPLVQKKYSEHYQSRLEFYSWLGEKGELIKVFSPDQDIPGDEVRIYRMSPSR